MPSKSQMALALYDLSVLPLCVGAEEIWSEKRVGDVSRFRVDLVEESTAVLLVEDSCESPWLVLHWLHIHDLDNEDISRLSSLDLEWASQIMDLGQIDVLYVVCAVVVADLATSPVNAFNLDGFAIFNSASEWDCLTLAYEE